MKDEEKLVNAIHLTPNKGVIIVTGGGTDIFPMLLRRGGGSATLLSGRIPYGEEETVEILGGKPEKFVSELTARQLAMSAYQMALQRRQDNEEVFGVSCSSSLQRTPTERQGRVHYIYAALQTSSKTVSLALTIADASMVTGFNTPENIRLSEENLNTLMLLNLIAEGCNLEDRTTLERQCDLRIVRTESFLGKQYLSRLLDGTIPALRWNPRTGTLHLPEPTDMPMLSRRLLASQRAMLLPGSFNPAHACHVEMANYLSNSCDFELSIRNVDKPALDFISIQERLDSLRTAQDNYFPRQGYRNVWLTNAPTFVEKSRLFPGATFVIGYDTALRIIDPKYAGSVSDVLSVFETNDTKFLVFGREVNGQFLCDMSTFPLRFLDRCTALVAEPLKHTAISSTQIRGLNNE